MQFGGDLNKQQSHPDDPGQTGRNIFTMKQGFYSVSLQTQACFYYFNHVWPVSYTSYSYMVSFIGATILQSRPLKCFVWLAVRKKKDYCLTDRLRVILYSDSPVNYFYPFHVPSPAGVRSWCWVRRQESMKKGHQAIRYNRATVIQALNFHQSCSTVWQTCTCSSGGGAPLQPNRNVFYFEMQLLDLTWASINVETRALPY